MEPVGAGGDERTAAIRSRGQLFKSYPKAFDLVKIDGLYGQLSLEELTGVRRAVCHDIRDRSLGHDGPPSFSTPGAKIDDVVGAKERTGIYRAI